MATCFIFINQVEFETLLSLRLDDEGQIEALLAYRSEKELQKLQQDARTIIVISARFCSIQHVQLPWIKEQKAREALPYAMEEKLAQNVETLHFSFDRQYYQNNQYLVIAIDKSFLTDLIEKLESWGISFLEITTDWFSLNEGESCAMENALLVNSADFNGGLTIELAEVYLKNNPTLQWFSFNDSLALHYNEGAITQDVSCFLWVAKRLAHKKFINISQGSFQRTTGNLSSRFWYRLSAGLVGVTLVTLLLLSLAKIMIFNQQIKSVEGKIAVIYRQFFPESKRVISPRFRIEQALKLSQGEQNIFWELLNHLAKSYEQNNTIIQQLNYQDGRLIVSLTCDDFSTLESLQKKLQGEGLLVRQVKAATKEGQVIATLELAR